MNWQPPPPPPRPGGQGPGPGQGGGGQQRPGPTPGGPNGQQPQQQQQQQPQQAPGLKDWKEMNFYQLLQVNREAHSTIIRYAYRFLAAMYHPDNSETGDAEKFRIITEAWRTLSDEGKRAAYDMSLVAEEAQPRHPGAGGAPGAQQSAPRQPGYGLPKNIKLGLSWVEIELRLAILQILLEARKKKPKSGGASAKLIMDVLQIDNVEDVEYAIWYLREKGLIEHGERVFMISVAGVDYIVDQMTKTQSINESETEKKVKKVVDGGVPAVIPR